MNTILNLIINKILCIQLLHFKNKQNYLHVNKTNKFHTQVNIKVY